MLSSAGLRHVLLHEAAHLRRHDLRWHWAGHAVLIIHWLNPLVWLALRRMRADREAACDDVVLGALSGDGRLAYGTTLLFMQEHLSQPSTVSFRLGVLGSTDRLRERILDIAHHGRRSRAAGAAALAFSFSCAGMLAIAAGEPPKDVKPATLVPPSASEIDAPAGSIVVIWGASLSRRRLQNNRRRLFNHKSKCSRVPGFVKGQRSASSRCIPAWRPHQWSLLSRALPARQ